MNLPNRLTIMRIILVPFFVLFLLCDNIPYSALLALLVFAVASITDYLDGKIARSRNLITNFGKFLDPMADIEQFPAFAEYAGKVVAEYKSMVGSTQRKQR